MRTLFVLFFAVVPVRAADIKEAPRPLPKAEGNVGRLVPDVAFIDVAGKAGKLSDFAKQKYLVVAVTNGTCPLSKKFAPTLAKLEAEYAAKGVAFLFVNPTKTDKPTSTFVGPYVHDADGTLAAAFGFTSTTEVVILDAARTIVYRGAIDDQYGLGYALDTPKRQYLRSALDALLAGKSPEVVATTAPGCALDLVKPTATAATYHNRISRIVQQHCQECHRPDGVGPFSLASYDDVASHKAMIRKVVDAGTMPPWFAAEGKDRPHFLNDRSLSPADKSDLLAWLKGDLATGDPADAPLPKAWPSGWEIGKPDAVFQIPKPIAIKATGTMPYQIASVETTFDEDKWVQAFEIRPTNKAVVHHVLVHVGSKEAGGGRPLLRALLGRAADEEERRERQGFFAAYVPGNSFQSLETGYARKLPKGATLHFQIHYTPNGEATTDQTRIGLVFAKEPPKSEVKVVGVSKRGIVIPAGHANHEEVQQFPVPADTVLRAAMPHMHVRGKACKYEVTTPDGKTTLLLDVPRYDFNWQLCYQFAEPVAVTKGSTITFTVWYDNSTKNPANPDATKIVKWGPQTSDEMHLGYLEYIVNRAAKDVPAVEKPTIP